jgi:hypothetical protein
MLFCGVKFCGGCNPRFERRKVLEQLKEHFEGRIEFAYAQEGIVYDILLIFGGCTNCCASFSQYTTKRGNIKLWDVSHVERVIEELEGQLSLADDAK